MGMKQKEPGSQSEERAYDDEQTMYGTARWRHVCASSPLGARKQETRMGHRLGLRSWATGILVLAAVTACGQNSASPPATSSAPVSTPSPSPSSSPSAPASPSEVAAAEATQKLKDYFAVLDQLGQHPSAPVSPLAKVSTSALLTAEQHFVEAERAKGHHQTGVTHLVDVKVQSVDLDNSNPSAGSVPTVVIDVCWDVRDVDVIDRTGKSAVLATRPDGGITRYFVANYQWKAHPDTGWRVADAKDRDLKPCTAV